MKIVLIRPIKAFVMFLVIPILECLGIVSLIMTSFDANSVVLWVLLGLALLLTGPLLVYSTESETWKLQEFFRRSNLVRKGRSRLIVYAAVLLILMIGVSAFSISILFRGWGLESYGLTTLSLSLEIVIVFLLLIIVAGILIHANNKERWGTKELEY